MLPKLNLNGHMELKKSYFVVMANNKEQRANGASSDGVKRTRIDKKASSLYEMRTSTDKKEQQKNVTIKSN